MRILLVHNAYGKFSGEEAVFNAQAKLLKDNGHEVLLFERSSAEIKTLWDKVRAFFSGIYNPFSSKKIRILLQERKPDIIHVHNLFPFISPSILPVCRKAGIPVVMTVHNYRLLCPNGLHMTNGQLCERCNGGNEWWCVIRNCENGFFKSFGYALRTYIARYFRLFFDNITAYACLTEFHKRKLIAAGFPEERIFVLPNMCDIQAEVPSPLGDYVGFIGRVSLEKGIDILLACARILPTIPFRIAGHYDYIPKNIPPNVEFCGFLRGNALHKFRQGMKMAVMPSQWYETFGLILVEAAMYGKPVIATRLGAMAEIVDDGITGFLFELGNAEDLANKIKILWDNTESCTSLGKAGRLKALREYSSDKYYTRLLDLYKKAITAHNHTN
jgi:glycosyltransferase involved in cell wall biosynthesis